MKCPILYSQGTPSLPGQPFEVGRCQQGECSWYVDEAGGCSIMVIAGTLAESNRRLEKLITEIHMRGGK